jgi:hypothetical protein
LEWQRWHGQRDQSANRALLPFGYT